MLIKGKFLVKEKTQILPSIFGMENGASLRLKIQERDMRIVHGS